MTKRVLLTGGAGLNLRSRFWNNVDILDKDLCWNWKASKTKHGYGRINVNKKIMKSHRVAWILTWGEINNEHVLHKCDNPSCCNPNHLFIGTHQDNMKDKLTKGRQSKGLKHSLRPRGRGESVATAKLTEKEVKEIYNSQNSLNTLAKMYNVSKRQIFRIKHNESWKHATQ